MPLCPKSNVVRQRPAPCCWIAFAAAAAPASPNPMCCNRSCCIEVHARMSAPTAAAVCELAAAPTELLLSCMPASPAPAPFPCVTLCAPSPAPPAPLLVPLVPAVPWLGTSGQAPELPLQVREVRVGAEGAVDKAARPASPMPQALRSKVRRLGQGWLHSARTPVCVGQRSRGQQIREPGVGRAIRSVD
eukprot:1142893-Pelagomonas_calceolata.AAC.3